MSSRNYDLTGKVYEGKVKVFIRPGFGVRLPDPDYAPKKKSDPPEQMRHFGYEDGEIQVPVAIASDMLHDGRAFISEDGVPTDETGEPVDLDVVADAQKQASTGEQEKAAQ